MKKILLPFVFSLLTFSSAQLVFADQTLTPDQIRSVFTDRTFDGVNTKSGRAFSIYFSPDGTIAIAYSDGKSASGTWNVTDDGQHCVSLSGCSYVIDKGEDVYHKIKDGAQTHLLKNPRAGKQLAVVGRRGKVGRLDAYMRPDAPAGPAGDIIIPGD